MSTYIEFFEKVQGEFLKSIQQAQELNVKTINAMTDLVSSVPSVEAHQIDGAKFPTPVELVERSFAFTNQLIETRKEYAIRLAELATEAQKQFADTAKRVADAAKN
jgi:hypothetical protein